MQKPEIVHASDSLRTPESQRPICAVVILRGCLLGSEVARSERRKLIRKLRRLRGRSVKHVVSESTAHLQNETAGHKATPARYCMLSVKTTKTTPRVSCALDGA
eukprot:2595397-Pleurochrysis_carterae.AAC.3